MQYDRYQGKVKKIAAVLGKVYAVRIFIIITLAAVATLTTVMVAAKGLIVAESDCPVEVVYGEVPDYDAVAFLGKVTFEYREKGSSEWSAEAPDYLGDYQVRAVSTSSFGTPRYGDVYDFTVIPREITPTVADTRVIYGETPRVEADMAGDDSFSCDVLLEYPELMSALMWVDARTFTVTDGEGNDRTDCYVVKDTPAATVALDPRPLEITVEDADKVYDGVALTFDGYEISEGTLAEGDSLMAIFDASITVAGTLENTPRLAVLSAEGHEISARYDMTVKSGRLTVEHRPLIIQTGSSVSEYNGYEQFNQQFTLDSSTPLVDGHYLQVETVPTLLDCGTVENTLVFAILDSVGEQYQSNYSIFLKAGTVQVVPKKITIRSGGVNTVYDGNYHSNTDIKLELPPTDRFEVVDYEFIRDAGSVPNEIRVEIYRDDREISSNYDITYEFGTLTVTPRPITVQIGDLETVYDGTYPSFESLGMEPIFEVLVTDDSYGLVSEHVLTLETKGSVFFGEGVIDYVEGSIRIGWEYDPNFPDTEIPEDEKESIAPPQPRIAVNSEPLPDENVGEQDDPYNYTANYEVTVIPGKLNVVRRPIAVTSNSAAKQYDGKPLTAPGGQVIADYAMDLVEGHILHVNATGSAVEYGIWPNPVDPDSIRITNALGEDKTPNYEVVAIEEGTLTVFSRVSLKVTTADASKWYDGAPLICEQYRVEYEGGELPAGFTVQVEITGSQTQVGTSENTANVYVLDAYGNQVPDEVISVTLSLGTLTVFDGEALPVQTFGYISTDHGGIFYLRMNSYGDLNGSSWTLATPYGEPLPGGYGYHYMASEALKNLGYSENILHFSNMSALMLPYFIRMDGMGPVISSDTLGSGDWSENFSVNYYYSGSGTELITLFMSLTDEERSGLLGEYADEELAYRDFVHREYSQVPSLTRSYLMNLIAEQGFDANDPEVIAKVAKYIQNAATYDLNYDRTLDSDKNMVISFLRDYKAGVCRHYAAAATMVYRMLGIPARYTTGYMVEANAGEWTPIESPGHAWVEVYIDGLGWVPVEVTGSMDGDGGSGGSGGSGETRPEEQVTLELIPAFGHKVYDGTALCPSGELVLTPALEALLKQGYTYSVLILGSQLEVGEGVSRIAYFQLLDPSGNDVTSRYRIEKRTGLLLVTGPAVEVYLYPLEKIYDGLRAEWGDEDYMILFAPDGLTLELEIHIPNYEVGIVTVADLNRRITEVATYRIYQNGLDVTHLYPLVFSVQGMEDLPVLVISPRPIELTAASEERVDDGTPLSNQNVHISKGSLVGGHQWTAVAIGWQEGIGTAENIVDPGSVVIWDPVYGWDVTVNYQITYVKGSLTLTEEP